MNFSERQIISIMYHLLNNLFVIYKSNIIGSESEPK